MGYRPFLFLVSIVMVALVGGSLPASAAAITQWVRPVAGEIVEPFDAPRSRFGAGHLGVDIAAARGTAVHAAGPGVVTFAGTVAGGRHVVIAHAGNLRTSYSFLMTIAVRRGAKVAAGDVVGTTGGTGRDHDGSSLHVGLRSGDVYVDPTWLFEPVDLTKAVHLAPTTDPRYPPSAKSERRGLLAGLARGAGAIVHAAGTGASATGRVFKNGVIAVTGKARRLAVTALPLHAAVGRGFAEWLEQRGHCDSHAPDADGTGGSDHRVMIVAGLDSSLAKGGRSTNLPAEKLGYESGEVNYFSYAADGGDYTAADTEGSLRVAARRLGRQLRALQRKEPGREVDLIGHSQGGVIVAEFLAHVYRSGDPSYPPLGTVIALASPFKGSTGATAVARIGRSRLGRDALNAADAIADATGAPIPSSQGMSIRELSKDSNFIRDLETAALPWNIQITAIADGQDTVAPAGDSVRSGAQNLTLFPAGINGHSAIVGDPGALRVARAGIEGKSLPCQSLTTIVAGEVVSTAIADAERHLGEVGELVSKLGSGR